MNTRVSHHTSFYHEIMQAITKAIKVVRSQKSFSDLAIRSDFSFAKVDKISVTLIFLFFLDRFRVAKLSELLGEYLWANINVSNFISLYLRAEVNFEVVL